MKRSGNILKVLILSIMFTYSSFSQTDKLFQVGKNLIEFAKTDNPDKILNYLKPDLEVDKKAEILESFLSIRDKVFGSMDKNKIKLFNVIKQTKNTLFIITDGQKFYIVKSQTDEKGLITDHLAIIKNDVAKSLTLGQKIYKIRCYACHGKEARGGVGPNLIDDYWKYVTSAQDLQEIIAKGKKGTMMIAFKDYLSPDELKAVTLYIKALQGKIQKNAKKGEGEYKKLQFEISNN